MLLRLFVCLFQVTKARATKKPEQAAAAAASSSSAAAAAAAGAAKVVSERDEGLDVEMMAIEAAAASGSTEDKVDTSMRPPTVTPVSGTGTPNMQDAEDALNAAGQNAQITACGTVH
jgi:hypothetical protein